MMPILPSFSSSFIVKTFFLALVFCFFFFQHNLYTQAGWDRDYFDSSISVDEAFPGPHELMGFQPGEWHPNHIQVELFMDRLAELSPRMVKKEIGRSHENRPYSVLIVSASENLDRLDELRECHLASIDPDNFSCADGAFNPLVLYQAYTSHGNEPSGTGAALLYAWFLAAADDEWVDEVLSETVIIIDPVMNPDGYDRFVSWVNSKRWLNAEVSDPNDDEFNQPWPGSRTNHFWFDLNRDWLPVQHPESVAKIRLFQAWKPNVLGDYHEMGSNATYFFQPGVPSRTNPMTPQINQDLTAAIAEFHADALDELSVPYYTKERFDDYYYGKGSTYPDIQGCVGILFEQASSRGHVQQTIHGPLTFAETIRNQLATSFSTLRGSWELREELKDYQQNFFQEVRREARRASGNAYRFEMGNDPYLLQEFVRMMATHDIKVYEGEEKDGKKAYYVPFEQTRYYLVRTIFEKVHEFPDSLFYDVSTWTMSSAFGIDAETVTVSPNFIRNATLLDYESNFNPANQYQAFEKSAVGYIFEWNHFLAPGLLYDLLREGVKSKVAFSPFSIKVDGGENNFSEGSILILPGIQNMSEAELHQLLSEQASEKGIRIHAMDRGLSTSGIDPGSPTFRMLNLPKILMVTGSGINSNNAGAIWYYFDRHLHIPVTKVSNERLGRVNLSDYDVVIVPSTWGLSMPDNINERIQSFVSDGNTLIVEGEATRWATSAGISRAQTTNLSSRPDEVAAYADIAAAFGAFAVGGCIVESKADLTNPLFFGYDDDVFHVFKRKRWVLELPENKLSAPLQYASDPLVSGYLHTSHPAEISEQASILVESRGRGRIIHLSDAPFFRGYWFSTAHIMSNAVFFGGMIDRRAAY